MTTAPVKGKSARGTATAKPAADIMLTQNIKDLFTAKKNLPSEIPEGR